MQWQHDAVLTVLKKATCLLCACSLSRLTVTADLMAAITRLLPDVIAAAQREPDAEALAKAGAAICQLADAVP